MSSHWRDDKFVGTPKDTPLPICNSCRNHTYGTACRAFDIIPDAIIFGDVGHDRPLPGQMNTVVYERVAVNRTELAGGVL